ncbi:MAG: DUF2959 domain-containing protein [Desulfuromonadaceae bacterium]|jgi:SMC interacting uncharacterized protein involved in chromosome segregation
MKNVSRNIPRFWLLLAGVLVVTGCQTAYFSTMEKFGYHKRDILVSRVEDARDAQTEAKDQFKSALEQFSAVTGFKGGELEEKYELLNDEYENSKSKAEQVSARIDAVEDVAEALFDEWEEELEQYSNAGMRRSSSQQLEQTRKKYQQMIKAMRKAESKIEPVLTAFHDQVLFLKHNLNAQAIASLRQELSSVETDINALIKEMESSIREADTFISSMANN